MSVHVPSLCAAILIATAEVVMLRVPAGKPAVPHKMPSPPWSLCTGSVCWGHMLLVVRAISLGNVCEIYGLAVFSKKPNFC